MREFDFLNQSLTHDRLSSISTNWMLIFMSWKQLQENLLEETKHRKTLSRHCFPNSAIDDVGLPKAP